jgi:hypothetical protein
MMKLLAAVIVFCCCVADAAHSVASAKALFLSWVSKSKIPGKYTTLKERMDINQHPGDLNNHVIFSEESLRNGNQWPHTLPNNPFDNNPNARKIAKKAIAWNLRRGMSRLQDTIIKHLDVQEKEKEEMSEYKLSHILTLGRRALFSFESFWKQVEWTFDYGERQLKWHKEWKEYGPETNFWLKFRPTLTCSETVRKGPEIGGAKTWCNPKSLAPRVILSAGSGDDFLYEHIAAREWPGVVLVTTDCYQFDQATDVLPFFEDSKSNDKKQKNKEKISSFVVLPVCLTSSGETTRDRYIQLAPSQLHSKFVSFQSMLKLMKQEKKINQNYFDLIKCNIEASEYPLFADAFRRVDENFIGTNQINIEMHRMGMHGNGLNFNSLLFMELLFSHFYSGGYHPIFTEKWHDQNAAQDVVWVNQTYWMNSELNMIESIWNDDGGGGDNNDNDNNNDNKKNKNVNSGEALLSAHLNDEDPFISPIPNIIPNRAKKLNKGKKNNKRKKFEPPKTVFKGPNYQKPTGDVFNQEQENKVLYHARPDPELTDDIVARLQKEAFDAIGNNISLHTNIYFVFKNLRVDSFSSLSLSAFIMLVPYNCHTDERCQAFPKFWSEACSMFPKYVFIAHCSSVPGSGHCGPEIPSPQIMQWDGLQFQQYEGEKSFEAVLKHMAETIREEPDMTAFMNQMSGHPGEPNGGRRGGIRLDEDGDMENQVKQMENLFSVPVDDDDDDVDDVDDSYDDDYEADDEGEWEDHSDFDDDGDEYENENEYDSKNTIANNFASKMPDTTGQWKNINIEMVDDLSHDDFVSNYVEKQLPVVLRRPKLTRKMKNKNMFRWMKTHCDLRGEHATIHVFDSDPESVGWAGFNFNEKTEMKLDAFFKELHREHEKYKKNKKGNLLISKDNNKQYGFDYRLICSCPKLLDRFPQLRYFQGDVLQVDPLFPRVHWPVLIAGPSGSKSALHVDSHFLPFYLTVLSGTKHFRIITLQDWRNTLTPHLYDHEGVVLHPIDAYDDEIIEQQVLSRGANVYNITLNVGDTIYIPTGALHGAIK